MNKKSLFLILVITAAMACSSPAPQTATAPVPSGPIDLSAYRIVDMSYTFDENTIYWPTDMSFEHKEIHFGPTPGGYFYSTYQYGASEHGGTHLDSPIHFGQGKMTSEQIPVSRLVGPAEVIDIAAACAANRDYPSALQYPAQSR